MGSDGWNIIERPGIERDRIREDLLEEGFDKERS
jgi:hypothetical protein